MLMQAGKDLRTAFRDRSTLIQTILVPLALYPVMFWVMIQANSVIEGQKAGREVTAVIVAEEEQAAFAAALLAEWDAGGAEGVTADEVAADGTANRDSQLPGLTKVRAALEPDAGADPDALLFGEDPVDAVLTISTADGLPALEVHTDSSRASSELAGSRLSDWLDERGRLERRRGADRLESTLDGLAPFQVRKVDVSESEEIGAFLLSLLLPMMLVVMGTLGAFYPAVDLTAGEHERRTHETTLLAPVPRVAIQLGKVIAVTLCSVLAAAMNLLGMALAANHLLGMLGDTGITFTLPTANLLLTLPFVAAFLLFVSAVLCATASLTRTFKQGQSLLGSVQLVFLLPAMVTTMPTLQLTAGLAALPVVGVSLAFRTLLRGGPLADLPVVPLLLVLVFQVVYALLAVWISLRLLDQEPDGDSEATAITRLRQLLLPRRS